MKPLEQREPEFSDTVLGTTLAAVAERRAARKRTQQAAALVAVLCGAAILFWPAPSEQTNVARREAPPSAPRDVRSDVLFHTTPLSESALVRTTALPESQLLRTDSFGEQVAFRTTETIPSATEAELLLAISTLNGALVRQPDGTRLVVVLK